MRQKTPLEQLIDWLEDQIESYCEPILYDEDLHYVNGLKDTLEQALYLNDLHG